MPAVAEVQFKAAGSQQVVSAFNSVGSAAQSSSTKVQQNSTAMSSLGKGMKSSVAGIGQVTTAFATLSLSIVSTWRAYRDLGDAQLAVDRANLKVKKTQEAIKKTTAEIAALQKAGNKGGLEAQRRRIDLTKLTIALTAAQKKYGKNSIEAADAALKLKEAQVAGGGSSEKLRAAQEKLAIQQEQLGIAQTNAGEQQERFNDTQQNFYLSILPLGISTIATLTSAFSGFKGMLTGGGGLLGGLGPIALILTGISVAILAFKTNFLGLRDAIGGVIDWLKARFGVWKDTIEKVFNLIKSGDWNGAFAMIKEAAAKFWADLKKTVPLFGAIDDLIQKIMHGNWKGAFLQIWKAATDAWAIIKKNIPFLGDIEKFIQDIADGNWQAIPDAIVKVFNDTLGKGIEWIFGKNWKAGLDAKIAEIQAEAAVNKRSVPIQLLIEINAAIKDVTGVDIGKWFTDHPLTSKIPFFAGITMMVDDPKFRASVIDGAIIVVNALGTAIASIATAIDPYIAGLFVEKNWTDAIESTKQSLLNAGKVVWKYIFDGIGQGLADQDWTKLIGDVPLKIQEATKKNMPQTYKTSTQAAKGGPLNIAREKLNVELNPLVPDNAYTRLGNQIQEFFGKQKAVVTPSVNNNLVDIWERQAVAKINSLKPVIKPTADMSNAMSKWNQFVKKVESTKIRVPIVTYGVANIGGGGRPNYTPGYVGPSHQHGYQGTVKRPTTFIAGEGGRPEDVTVRPRGSVQRGGAGGGFNGTINVYVDGVLRPARYDMGARK